MAGRAMPEAMPTTSWAATNNASVGAPAQPASPTARTSSAGYEHAARAVAVDEAAKEDGARRRAETESGGSRHHSRGHRRRGCFATSGAIGPSASELEPMTPMQVVST